MLFTTKQISEFDIQRMLSNSMVLIDKRTQETYLIHRRIFNLALNNPEMPLFPVKREYEGKSTKWLATISTL